MTTAIPAQSFINPSLQEGVSTLKLFLHNFYSLGRTNVLRHILYPTPESIDGLLKGVWVRAHLYSFSSPSEAQDTISHELSMVHPLALKRYETAIKTADTFEKIKELAKSSFKTTDRIAKDLKQSISPLLDKKLSDPKVEKEKITVRNFLRSIISDCSPPEEGEPEIPFEEIQSNLKFPDLIDDRITSPPVKEKYEGLKTASTKEELFKLAEDLYNTKDYGLSFPNPTYATERDRIKGILEKTWKELILKADTFTSKEEASELVKSHLEPLNLPALTHLYLQDLSLAKLRNIKKRAESYLLDLHSIKFANNLIPLSDGQTAYPKIIDLKRAETISGFMKHLRSEEEMEHHRIYSFFLDLFQTEETETSVYTLSTAAASMLSQSPLTYTHPFPLNHKEEIVPHEQTGYAKYLISYIANANTFLSEKTGNSPRILSFEQEKTFQQLIQESPLVFFEDTQGQNIDKWFDSFYKPLTWLNAEIDSLKTKISDLKARAALKETEEKFIQAESILEKIRPLEIELNNLERQKKAQQDLFIHLGSIAFLDLILGNFDRLICFNPQNPDWDDVMNCNLGNLMVSDKKKALYAIDNGIGDGKHAPKTEEEDSEEKRIYLEFLARELSSENFETKMATKLVSLLKESLQAEGRARDLVKNLNDEEREVNEDLKPITSYLREGILSMKKKLLEKGIDAWHAVSFKETLHSGLKETVESRLSILQESLNITKAGT